MAYVDTAEHRKCYQENNEKSYAQRIFESRLCKVGFRRHDYCGKSERGAVALIAADNADKALISASEFGQPASDIVRSQCLLRCIVIVV